MSTLLFDANKTLAWHRATMASSHTQTKDSPASFGDKGFFYLFREMRQKCGRKEWRLSGNATYKLNDKLLMVFHFLAFPFFSIKCPFFLQNFMKLFINCLLMVPCQFSWHLSPFYVKHRVFLVKYIYVTRCYSEFIKSIVFALGCH